MPRLRPMSDEWKRLFALRNMARDNFQHHYRTAFQFLPEEEAIGPNGSLEVRLFNRLFIHALERYSMTIVAIWDYSDVLGFLRRVDAGEYVWLMGKKQRAMLREKIKWHDETCAGRFSQGATDAGKSHDLPSA
jgi:hypothetical protein